MGVDIWAMKPGTTEDSLNEPRDDTWYTNPIACDYDCQQFWKCWHGGLTFLGHRIPDRLLLDMMFPADDGNQVASDIEAFAQSLGGDGELESYVVWLRYWAGKGAWFYTSL
jgi:hypothetical protein